jgi:hypothetical protein
VIVHEIAGYWTRVGGEWLIREDEPPILVGGEDVFVQPPPEHHTDDCPCIRCYETHTASNTIALDQEGEEPKDPEMTPEDLERLKNHGL